jgi:hypothetical protein
VGLNFDRDSGRGIFGSPFYIVWLRFMNSNMGLSYIFSLKLYIWNYSRVFSGCLSFYISSTSNVL